MNPDLTEFIPNVLALAILATAALGALALPWSDGEIKASRDAWMRVFAWVFGEEEPMARLSADDLLPAPLPRPATARAPLFHVAARRAAQGGFRR